MAPLKLKPPADFSRQPIGVLAPFHPLTRRMAPFEKVKWPLSNLVDYRT
jgi:hypothetical protein